MTVFQHSDGILQQTALARAQRVGAAISAVAAAKAAAQLLGFAAQGQRRYGVVRCRERVLHFSVFIEGH